MENQKLLQACLDRCRECADECAENAKHCADAGMDECATLCNVAANACNRLIAEAKTNNDVFKDCANACKACAEECEIQDNIHCTSCAENCRKCEEACNSMIKELIH